MLKNNTLPAILLATTLGACTAAPFSGPYKAPEVQTYGEKGESVVKADVKAFETGIIKAFPDTPIPSSHRINLDKSVIFTSPSQTVGKIALAGSGDADSLYRFFEEQMVSNGWSMVNAFQSATSSMYFAKPGKFTAIIIESTPTGSDVYINVGPE